MAADGSGGAHSPEQSADGAANSE
ncbi:hypothetical protein NOVOSPHI9U_260260 [Novosphingobium sp. 9U]|nr:hypothetical protein NOVOSPHI9U_260260 [Novosphingobium sp. 9U]